MVYYTKELGYRNMFIENKYFKWYNNIINNRKVNPPEGYIENHHIIPKSLGGSDEPDNLVPLTAREHYLCHYMLTKCTTGVQKTKMIHAFHRMNFDNSVKTRKKI